MAGLVSDVTIEFIDDGTTDTTIIDAEFVKIVAGFLLVTRGPSRWYHNVSTIKNFTVVEHLPTELAG